MARVSRPTTANKTITRPYNWDGFTTTTCTCTCTFYVFSKLPRLAAVNFRGEAIACGASFSLLSVLSLSLWSVVHYVQMWMFLHEEFGKGEKNPSLPPPPVQYPVLVYITPVLLYITPVLVYITPVLVYITPVLVYITPVLVYITPVLVYNYVY